MIAAVILSAGASSRMGRPKALLAVPGGGCFLSRLVETFVAAEIDLVAVVVGPGGAAIRALVDRECLAVDVVENPDPSRGQLSSLLAALEWLEPRRPRALLVTPVDHPLVSVETVRRVVEGWRQSGAPIVRPAHGARHGHPVLFDAAVFPELRAADPSTGARSVVRAHGTRVVDVAVDDAGAFDDIDTPADYRRVFGVDPPW